MISRIRLSTILSLAATTTTNITTTTTILFVPFATVVSATNPAAFATTNNNKTTANSASFVVSASGDRVTRTYLTSSSSSIGSSNNYDNNNITNFQEGKKNIHMTIDKEYPGTAVERMLQVRNRVAQLKESNDLYGKPWEEIRRKLLWAGGLRDLPDAIPGQGYTGHSFNDYNHVDLTCMAEQVSDNQNDGSVYREIARGNLLGPGIRMASLPELGPGGSWSTCANGCNLNPPQDVAHIQFKARIAFKLVWVPNDNFDTFVLVDDDGNELARGKPLVGEGQLPSLRQRQMNYAIVKGSKYAVAAENIAKNIAAE